MATILEHHKPRNIQKWVVQRYARINKNIINSGELGRLIRDGFTGRDLYVLVSLLAEAQRRGKRTLKFKSENAILEFLGWQDCIRDYVDLECALVKWSEEKLKFRAFYKPQKRRRGRRNEIEALREPRSIDLILKPIYLDNGVVKIEFGKVFWKLNEKKGGYFVKAWPHHIKELSRPHYIALHLYLEGFVSKLDGKFGNELKRDLDRLARVLGMNMDRPSRFAHRLEKALGRVNAVTRNFHRCKTHKDKKGWCVVFTGDPKIIPLPVLTVKNFGL